MAGNPAPEGLADDFLEQILAVQPAYGGGSGGGGGGSELMGLQLGTSSIGSADLGTNNMGLMPSGFNLELLRQREEDDNNHNSNIASSSSPTSAVNNDRDTVHMASLFPAFGQLQTPSIRPASPPPQLHQQPFHSQQTTRAVFAGSQPTIRPRVRARRGQATDPHSIAERLRRERIAERIKALQELVPTANKTDRAAMLDEIVDYVKFLRLQVKVLSMSRLGGAGAVAQLVADLPLSSLEAETVEGEANQPPWEKWSNDGTEQQVAKLMEEDVGAAMQFLQSKALCIMPISLASAIFSTRQSDPPPTIKPETNTLS